MIRFNPRVAALATATVLVAACSAAAAPADLPAGTSPATAPGAAATTEPSAPAPTPERSLRTGLLPAPSRTPLASVEPMAPARVTGTSVIVVGDNGAQAGEGDRFRIEGLVLYATDDTSDPRVNGRNTIHLVVTGAGSMGWESATTVLEAADGTWEGPCRGASWSDGSASDVTCWLTGTGAYEGLTYYQHLESYGSTATIDGMILPVPPPAAP